jgi:hypothetical protein
VNGHPEGSRFCKFERRPAALRRQSDHDDCAAVDRPESV